MVFLIILSTYVFLLRGPRNRVHKMYRKIFLKALNSKQGNHLYLVISLEISFSFFIYKRLAVPRHALLWPGLVRL
jgi:hypothetical protein